MNEAKGWNRAEGWGVSLRSIINYHWWAGMRPSLPRELVSFPGQIIVSARQDGSMRP